MLTELRFTPVPRDPCWDLFPQTRAAQYFGLLGWILDATPLDAGVPKPAAETVARAFCHPYQLTFLYDEHASGSAWQPIAGGWSCTLHPTVRNMFSKRPQFPLVCTSDPMMAEQMFYGETFCWEMRSHVAFLSARDNPPPDLAYNHVEQLLNRSRIDPAELTAECNVQGLLFPGVDGDFIEVVMFDETGWDAVQDELSHACDASGIAWSVVSEMEFKNTRWLNA